MGPHPSLSFGALGASGPWTTQHFEIKEGGKQPRDLQGTGWERVLRNRVWVLLGFVKADAHLQASRDALFQQMASSWSANPYHYVPSGTGRSGGGLPPVPVWALGFWGAASACLLGLIFLRGARTRRGLLATAIFALVAGLFFVASGGGVAAGSNRSFWLQLSGIQVVAAVFTIATVAFVAWRRQTGTRARRLASLMVMGNVGLQIVAWMFQLLGGALGLSSQFSLAQALVVLAALVWELSFSGIRVTNNDSPALPRHSRVLLFCGYIMAVATTVLFFSSLHAQATGTRLEPVFEAEYWVQRGALLLAVPLLVTVFLLRLLGWLQPSAAPAAGQGTEDHAAAGVPGGAASGAAAPAE